MKSKWWGGWLRSTADADREFKEFREFREFSDFFVLNFLNLPNFPITEHSRIVVLI